jgi:hypothetical protein
VWSFTSKTPNCEEILEEKNKWALNEELEISDELQRELIPKLVDEN